MKNRLLMVLLVALTMAACRAQKAPVRWSEVFRQVDTPYHYREVDFIRKLTGRGTPSAATASTQ